MGLEVIEIEFSFYMLPEFEQEAIALWGNNNLDTKLQEIANSLYKGEHLGGNIWKLRIGAKSKGKRGGARIIYAHFLKDTAIVLIEAYGKNNKEDLTPDEEEELRKYVKTLDIKGVLNNEQNKIRRIKAKVKVRGGLQPRSSATSTPQSKSKSSRRKKNKKKT